MKFKFFFLFLGLLVLSGILFFTPQSVDAVIASSPTTPAAGSWIWDDDAVSGELIPQYQLLAPPDSDYALLQSNGLHLSGGAQICHPYPGGQFGWTAEIRVLGLNGWQSVPTVNQWMPDEEGDFMTCATVWHSGVYAVFGYWERPEGWGAPVEGVTCDVLPEGENVYVGPASEFPWSLIVPNTPLAELVGGTCSVGGSIINGNTLAFLPIFGYYCACDSIFQLEEPIIPELPGPIA